MRWWFLRLTFNKFALLRLTFLTEILEVIYHRILVQCVLMHFNTFLKELQIFDYCKVYF